MNIKNIMNLFNSFKKNENHLIHPHRDEVKSMLNGTKPVCILPFPSRKDSINFLMTAVQEGKISHKKVARPTGTSDYKFDYIFCQHGKESDMDELIELNHNIVKKIIENDAQYHRRMGEILGYPNKAINAFIKSFENTHNAPDL